MWDISDICRSLTLYAITLRLEDVVKHLKEANAANL